jgi:Xaa-Pro dipeptidase
MSWQQLFSEHLQTRKSTVSRILADSGYDGIVIDAGSPGYYFDDQPWLHRPNHHFSHWCPVPGPGSLIFYRPGHQPVLFFVSPKDYWHDSPELGPAFWQAEFDIRIIESTEEAWRELQSHQRCVYHGPRTERAKLAGLTTEPPPSFWSRLNWERSFKSAYEIECTLDATGKAARGHKAAKTAFEAGASEREIYPETSNVRCRMEPSSVWMKSALFFTIRSNGHPPVTEKCY